MLRDGLTFFPKRPKKPTPSRSFSNDSRYKFRLIGSTTN